MAKFAFKAEDYLPKKSPDDHVVSAHHEDLGWTVSHSHKDPEEAYHQVHHDLMSKYVDNDERRGLISKKEARESIRFDTKLGTLKWGYKHPDSCKSEDCKRMWRED